MAFFYVELNRQSLDDWRAGISKRFRREFQIAADNIRQRIQRELDSQRLSYGSGAWAPLSKKYEKRKERDFKAGRAHFLSILKRTGQMMAGYMNGIEIDIQRTRVSVLIPYPNAEDAQEPKKDVRARAKAQQEGEGLGRRYRPFDLDALTEIAEDEFNDAMRRAAV